MPQTPPWLQSILEEHFEELGMLWELRQDALRDPAYLLEDVVELEERIEAHTDGLILGGAQSLPVLEKGLAGDERSAVFSAAYVLLRLNDKLLADRVMAALEKAEAEKLDGIQEALCHGPIQRIASKLKEIHASGPAPIAAAAAEVLAFHALLSPGDRRLAGFLTDTDPTVRRSAWRTVGMVDALANSSVSPGMERPYKVAMRDDDETVRREALLAATWTRQKWLLEHVRRTAQTPTAENWDALWLLAVLGQPQDLRRVLTIGRTTELGSRRFEVYASFGHPGVIDDLLMNMESKAPNDSVSAGVAFRKITGIDVDSDERVALPPEDGREPDDFDKEFLDEALLPNAQLARKEWQKVANDFAQGTRWRRGSNVTHQIAPDVLASLDMESQWELRLRDRFDGRWTGTMIDLAALRVPKPLQTNSR
jgi:uncharacterized protein (TIGR02270 family)